MLQSETVPMLRWIITGAIIALALVVASLEGSKPSFANPGGGSDRDRERSRGSGGNSSTGSQYNCPSGWQVYIDPKTNEAQCVRKSGGIIQELPAVGWNDVDPAFVEAAVLVHSGWYEQAIAAFTSLERPDDPYVLNYLGFSSRKLGRTEDALGYYHRALALRPDYVRVREYLGEGYAELGRIDEAREQLALIAAECGTGCEEYRALDAAISAYVTQDGR